MEVYGYRVGEERLEKVSGRLEEIMDKNYNMLLRADKNGKIKRIDIISMHYPNGMKFETLSRNEIKQLNLSVQSNDLPEILDKLYVDIMNELIYEGRCNYTML